MFNRKAYKEIARKQLQGRFTTPFLAGLLIAAVFILMNFRSFQMILEKYVSGGLSSVLTFLKNPGFTKITRRSVLITVLRVLVMSISVFAWTYLFIVLSHTTQKQSFKAFINGFSYFLQAFLGILWKFLWIFLWSLLFIIPGIVKAFSYSQMFMILSEYPQMSVKKAMKLSKIMTNGFKGELFVMRLTFLGWDILSVLTCFIGFLWLCPYRQMAFTNAYHFLKEHAIQSGVLTQDDFS